MDNEKQFFSNRLKNARRTLCAMKRFSLLALNYNSNFGDYQYIKLWDAVRYTKISFPSECRQHRAWIDSEVMRRIWIWLENLSVNFENKELSLTVV